jgi:UDP-glucose 4-epimerase
MSTTESEHMRIFLTGSRGFIGQAINEALHNAGYQVEGYDIKDGHDVLDAESIIQRINRCQMVIHLAAIEGQSAYKVMQTNLLGTWNVLNAARQFKVDKVLFASSVDALGVFQGEGIPEYLPLDDTYPCHPKKPYSISKKLAEEMCRHFSGSSGIPTICFRPPGVWDESTYHKITAARKKRPEYEWDPYWEYGAFLDIRDFTSAVMMALQKDISGFHTLLLSSDDITTSGMTSLQLVKKIHPNVPWRGGIEYESKPCNSLVKTENAKRLLGWSPKYSWGKYQNESKALSRTVVKK